MTIDKSPTPRLRDVVAALEKRGRQPEADYYSKVYPFVIWWVYGVPEEEVMNMPIDDIVELPNLPQKPLKYEGWNTFYFGRAAFVNSP